MSDVPKRFELAPQHRLAELEHLAERFFREVLDFSYDECLITDESDLRDFAGAFGDQDEAVQQMLDRLEEHYVIDASALGSTRIVDVLDLLAARGVSR